jgi:hypothetical protein
MTGQARAEAVSDPVERLLRMGFRRAADWRVEAGSLECLFQEHATAQNVLYAFISEGAVLYIGKTVRTLKQRMHGYRRPVATQSTNIKGNRLILEALAAGRTVEVYALPDTGLLYYGGFHINLAAGLEDSLVAALQPPWNTLGI